MKIRKDIAISDNGFVFDPVTGESYMLNEIGIEILNLYKDNKTQEEVKQILLDKYDVTQNELEKNLSDFESIVRAYNLTGNE